MNPYTFDPVPARTPNDHHFNRVSPDYRDNRKADLEKKREYARVLNEQIRQKNMLVSHEPNIQQRSRDNLAVDRSIEADTQKKLQYREALDQQMEDVRRRRGNLAEDPFKSRQPFVPPKRLPPIPRSLPEESQPDFSMDNEKFKEELELIKAERVQRLQNTFTYSGEQTDMFQPVEKHEPDFDLSLKGNSEWLPIQTPPPPKPPVRKRWERTPIYTRPLDYSNNGEAEQPFYGKFRNVALSELKAPHRLPSNSHLNSGYDKFQRNY